MKSKNFISVNKARVHNLKNVSIDIPKNTLTVITGPSGSGKSSLAFDTIYAEGQRRYIESLSSYARQFLGQQQAPDVESISGLSPAIAIDQKTTSKNPRSTVGTITEVYDYLRVLFARVGDLYCPETNEIIKSYTPGSITKDLMSNKEKTKIHLMVKINADNTKTQKLNIEKFRSMGFSRFYINGDISMIEEYEGSITSKDEVYAVIDRVLIKDGIEKRLTDSIEYGYKLGDGVLHVLIGEDLKVYSEHNISPVTGEKLPSLEPRLFSFNSPIGACSTCNGIGQSKVFGTDSLIFDDSLPILGGAIPVVTKKNSFINKMIECVMAEEGLDKKATLQDAPKKFINILFNGSKKSYKYKFKSENSNFEFSKPFPGIIDWLHKKYNETSSEKVRIDLENYMTIKTCHSCGGKRLNQIALSTLIDGHNIIDLCDIPLEDTYQYFKKMKLTGVKKTIAEKLLKEIVGRLKFLNDVGLNYLTLNRSAGTLSGGEAQRIRLATQIGSALSGVLYVLDEPSIGLHQRDNTRLIQTLKELRDIGNTVLVVEHDEETMLESDYIIDLGPGAGIHGGEITAHGDVKKFVKDKNSLTAKYLGGSHKISVPDERRFHDEYIKLTEAKHNNLQNVTIEIPHEVLTCITGVSGSGKSTLVHEVLIPAVKSKLTKKNRTIYEKTNYKSITGIQKIKSIIELDQSPIGRTPNSNPATYSGLFDDIRKLYSNTPESQVRGYKQGRFSFNVKGGRCEECEGNGVKKIEMHFLPDVFITCPECHGKRYNEETLSVLYRGKNIADILNMTIEEAATFFENHPRLKRILKTMNDVGLGYLKLGQPATTLSGGEAQRLKLSKELAKKTKGHTLYVLDEPTTGLHFEDVNVLLKAINSLVNQGNTVVVIEHNLDVIKVADHIIDLGPEGGNKGGTIVGTGTPEEIAKIKSSHTGNYIKEVLKKK